MSLAAPDYLAKITVYVSRDPASGAPKLSVQAQNLPLPQELPQILLAAAQASAAQMGGQIIVEPGPPRRT